MFALQSMRRIVLTSSRSLHSSSSRHTVTPLTMPALSPTMTEGSVTTWAVKEGESFVAGQVLLSIETDKASIDVEAMDDGIMGKIVVQNGTMGVQVGQLIGLLAEEEDDLSKIEIPTIAIPASTSPPPPASIPSASAPTASTSTLPPPTLTTPVAEPITLGSKKSHTRPSHSAPLSPSVLRLLSLHHVDDPSQIVATGKHGMLTKGDVMSFLGMITLTPSIPAPAAVTTPAREQTLNAADSMKEEGNARVSTMLPPEGASLRRLILAGLATGPSLSAAARSTKHDSFDDVLEDYVKRSTSRPVLSMKPSSRDDYLDL